MNTTSLEVRGATQTAGRIRRALRRHGVGGSLRLAWALLARLAYLEESHVWFLLDLRGDRPRVGLPSELEVVRATEDELPLLAELPAGGPPASRRGRRSVAHPRCRPSGVRLLDLLRPDAGARRAGRVARAAARHGGPGGLDHVAGLPRARNRAGRVLGHRRRAGSRRGRRHSHEDRARELGGPARAREGRLPCLRRNAPAPDRDEAASRDTARWAE